jgi:hypothetical protein
MLVLHASARWSSQRMQAQARQVFVAKDVTADVLPPPMYLIEARLVLSQALEGTLAPADASRGFDALFDAYGARVEYWRTHPPYGLERELLGEQHEAVEFGLLLARAEFRVVEVLPTSCLVDAGCLQLCACAGRDPDFFPGRRNPQRVDPLERGLVRDAATARVLVAEPPCAESCPSSAPSHRVCGVAARRES